MSILACVPKGYRLRDNQPEILAALEANWDSNDIQILQSDVGTGKSLILQTVASWQQKQGHTVATITPRVALQEQYRESFPDVPILKGSTRYRCDAMPDISCKEKKEIYTRYCRGCKFIKAKKEAAEATNAVFNLQSYLLTRDPREILLIDEAHTLFGLLSERYTLRVWKHKYDYPKDLKNYLDVLVWIEQTKKQIQNKINQNHIAIHQLEKTKSEATEEHLKTLVKERLSLEEELKKLDIVYEGIQLRERNFFIEHTMESYRGTMKPMLKVRPTDLTGLKSIFAKTTKKLILATASIHEMDLKKLGLAHKKHIFHSFPSPLGNEDRPIVTEFAGNMGAKYQEKNLPKLVDKIQELRLRHADSKGLVHVTYQLADSMRQLLDNDPNFIWHSQENKEKQLEVFKKAPPGTVFITAGMTAGVDLAGPDYGWQAIGKMMYPSQADPLIAEWYRLEKKWITWLTAREIIQAAGRVNRYKGDKAVTYILDSCFGNPHNHQFGLFQIADRLGLWPDYFKERLQWKKA